MVSSVYFPSLSHGVLNHFWCNNDKRTFKRRAQHKHTVTFRALTVQCFHTHMMNEPRHSSSKSREGYFWWMIFSSFENRGLVFGLFSMVNLSSGEIENAPLTPNMHLLQPWEMERKERLMGMICNNKDWFWWKGDCRMLGQDF